MFHEITAVTVCCDRCRAVADPWHGDAHFATTTAAWEVLVSEGWRMRPDRMLCPACVCALDGHLWSDWYRCHCGGREPDHRSGAASGPCPADVDYRTCDRCNEFDDRPHASVPASGRRA